MLRACLALLLFSVAQAGVQTPQCLGRISTGGSEQPLYLLPEPGQIGWTWQWQESRSSTSFTAQSGLRTETHVPEFSADGGSSWHKNMTDCALADTSSPSSTLKVTFSKTAPAETDF